MGHIIATVGGTFLTFGINVTLCFILIEIKRHSHLPNPPISLFTGAERDTAFDWLTENLSYSVPLDLHIEETETLGG